MAGVARYNFVDIKMFEIKLQLDDKWLKLSMKGNNEIIIEVREFENVSYRIIFLFFQRSTNNDWSDTVTFNLRKDYVVVGFVTNNCAIIRTFYFIHKLQK